MENKPILSERIRQRRVQKGYSQEYLADSAQVSIRTLQRIEGGQTEPRGHTLIALANALDIAIEDLMDFTKKHDKSVLHIINLSALAYWAIPLGNIIVPAIFWIINKDKVKGANQFGKRQVFIQLGWTILMFISFFLFLTGPFVSREISVNPGTFILLPPSLYLLDAIYIAFVFLMITREKQITFLGLEK